MRSVRIGRGRGNDIVIEDGTISRHHAELRMTEDGEILLVDLGSTNGTCVREDGRWIEIEQAAVGETERILLGEVITSVNTLLSKLKQRPAVDLPPDAARRVRTEPSIGPAQPPSIEKACEAEHQPDDGMRHRIVPDPDLDRRGPAWSATRRQAKPAAADPHHRGFDPGKPVGTPAHPRGHQRRPRPGRWLAVASLAVLLGAAGAFIYLWSDDMLAGLGQPNADAEATEGRGGSAADRVTEQDTSAGTGREQEENATGDGRNGAADAETPRASLVTASGSGQWQIRIGTGADDVFSSAVPGSGGLFAAGTRATPGGDRLWTARFAGDGTLSWQRTLGGARAATAASAFPTDDRGVIVVGHVNLGGDRRAPWMVRLDRTGRVVWKRRLEGMHSGMATFITGVPNGYAVAAAVTQREGETAKARIVKIDEQGQVLWTRTFADGITWPSAMRRARDGGVVVSGVHKDKPGEKFALWAARIDSRGALHWVRRYPHEDGADSASYVRRAAGDQYIVATTHTATNGRVNLRLVRLNGSGRVIWQHVHDTPGAERVSGLVLVRDGIIVAGSTENGSRGGRDLWLARVNTDGKLAWQRRYGGSGDDWATDIRPLSDRGFLISGVSQSDSMGGRDALLLRVDRQGVIKD